MFRYLGIRLEVIKETFPIFCHAL